MKRWQIFAIVLASAFIYRSAHFQELVFPQRYWANELIKAQYSVKIDRELLEQSKLDNDPEGIKLWTQILKWDQEDVQEIQQKLYF